MKAWFYFKLYLVTLAVFLGIDFIWLSFIAQSFYQQQIGFLLKPQPDVVAAVIFYAWFVVGILYFVVLPALKSKKINALHVGAAGGFLGLIAYATYDLTNYATLNGWPLLLVGVDMLWGTVLTAATSAISFKIGKKL